MLLNIITLAEVWLRPQPWLFYKQHQDLYRIWFRLAYIGYESLHKMFNLAVFIEDIRVYTRYQNLYKLSNLGLSI